VAVTGKSFLHRDVIHLINFTDAGSMEWRDNDGTRKEPAAVADALLTVKSDRTVKKVWSASPDYQGGAAMSLPFTLEGDNVTFTLPLLKYWDMVVLEYE
jgi:dextranase